MFNLRIVLPQPSIEIGSISRRNKTKAKTAVWLEESPASPHLAPKRRRVQKSYGKYLWHKNHNSARLECGPCVRYHVGLFDNVS